MLNICKHSTCISTRTCEHGVCARRLRIRLHLIFGRKANNLVYHQHQSRTVTIDRCRSYTDCPHKVRISMSVEAVIGLEEACDHSTVPDGAPVHGIHPPLRAELDRLLRAGLKPKQIIKTLKESFAHHFIPTSEQISQVTCIVRVP